MIRKANSLGGIYKLISLGCYNYFLEMVSTQTVEAGKFINDFRQSIVNVN